VESAKAVAESLWFGPVACSRLAIVARLPGFHLEPGRPKGIWLIYKIKNWHDYQHYKDRCPPWIKLHNSILTCECWVMGNDATRALLIASMLLASRNEANDGTFNGDPEYVKRFAYLNTKPDFNPLIKHGFIECLHDASKPLATCNTEKRREETEKSRTETETLSLPDWLPVQEWKDFLESRQVLKAKMTPKAQNLAIKKLAKLKADGHSPKEVLEQTIYNGWRGLFPIKQESVKKNGHDVWWASEASIQAKARELGLTARGGESWHEFKGRISQKIQELE
jgi:hypothetical protein